MALRTLTSPNKKDDASGMHTPAKNADSSFDGENLINSLRKRVASTALRPKVAAGRFALDVSRLENSDLSDISPDTPPIVCRQLHITDNESDQHPPLQSQRSSSLWLEKVISDGEFLAEKIKQDREKMESLQKSQLNDISSLGILTDSAMASSFNNTDVLRDTSKSLVKFKDKPEVGENSPVDSGNLDGTSTTKSDSTLVNSNASCSSVNFSNVNADYSPFMSPQTDLGFDSKDFISADDADFSAINKQLDRDKQVEKDPIPSPYRMDLNEFSGITGDGELEVRRSWLSPEKRIQTPSRVSIGEYFATKSSNMKELIRGIHPNRDSLLLHSPVKSHPSPLPTGLRPEYAAQKNPSQTIDLSQDDEEGNNTITLDETLVKPDDSVQCLDVTLVPGRNSVMSLSTIQHLLDSKKGANTLAEHLIDVAQQPTPPSKKTTPNTSRETFVITPPQPSQSKTTAVSKIPKLVRSTNSMDTAASSSGTPVKMRKSTPVKPKRRSPGRTNNYKSPLSKQSTTPINNSTAESLHKKITEQKKPKIQLPLHVEGSMQTYGVFHGVTNIPIAMHVTVTNISTSIITCTVADVGNSKYLEVKSVTPVVILPEATENLNIEVCALLSGSHFVSVAVQVKSAGTETSHSVDPVKLCIEPPKVCIITSEANIIDFGLCPEDTRKHKMFTVKNLGTCALPLQVSIDQCSDGSCFFLLVPADDEDLDVAQSVTMLLPGSAQTEEPTSQELFLLFVAPTLENMRANKDRRSELVELEGKITVRLDIPGNESLLATCAVQGQVGHTQMLVTESELTLHAGIPVLLGVMNAGVVPLDLSLAATPLDNSEKDPSVLIEPSTFILSPDYKVPVHLTWNPPAELEATVVQRELHLMYEGLIIDHIVTLTCCPRVPEYSDVIAQKLPPLPVRTTRPQLAWGSLSPGLTLQHFVTLKNTSSSILALQVKICAVLSTDIEPPFKVLSEAKEVTRELEMHLKAGQEQKVAVMFCPQRPGPASAFMTFTSNHPIPYASKKILLTGYGGHSEVILRKVASSQGCSWLSLSPGLGDFVDGTFYLVNTGNLPAYAHITSTASGGSTCSVTVKPDRMMVLPQGNECINVKLSNVRGILSKTLSGEIKTLASITVHWINEVTRKRLRRLMNHLNNNEKSILMKLEQATALNEVVESHIEGEEAVVSEIQFVGLRDFSVTSAASLSKDLATIKVDLRAEGTGLNHTRATETDTVSPFVSFLDATVMEPSRESIASSMNEEVNWSVSPRELSLHAGNTFCATLQISNMSTTEKLSLEIEAKEELLVTPSITEVLPCHSNVLEVRLKRTPLQTLSWPAAVRVFSKNDVVDISVRIYASNPVRIARHSQLANMSFQSATSGGFMTSAHVQGWMSGGVRTVTSGISRSILPQPIGLESLSQLQDAINSSTSSSSGSSYSSAVSKSNQPVTVTTHCITFPWTRVSNSSTSTLTLFNSSDKDKNIQVLSIRAPFSVEPTRFVVCAGWNFNINIKFSPQISGQCSEILTLRVEGQSELLSVTLRGPASV